LHSAANWVRTQCKINELREQKDELQEKILNCSKSEFKNSQLGFLNSISKVLFENYEFETRHEKFKVPVPCFEDVMAAIGFNSHQDVQAYFKNGTLKSNYKKRDESYASMQDLYNELEWNYLIGLATHVNMMIALEHVSLKESPSFVFEEYCYDQPVLKSILQKTVGDQSSNVKFDVLGR
jgi:hypothetical protein